MKRDHFLLTSSIVQFALFIPLAWWARKQRVPLSDVAITHLLQKKQSSFPRAVVKVLNTLTGSAVFMNVLVVPVTAVLWRMRLRLEAIIIIATCWMGGLVRSAIKQVVDRPRPNPLLVHVGKQSKGKSFPSGHVASSVCLWGWLFALGLLAKKKAQPGRKVLLGSAAMFVAFTGPARVYLGDHWATDVLGGYLFGGGWLSLSLGLYLRWRERGVTTKVPSLNKSNISASSGSSR
jgi:membrane-associated phospholipid phosphatase